MTITHDDILLSKYDQVATGIRNDFGGLVTKETAVAMTYVARTIAGLVAPHIDGETITEGGARLMALFMGGISVACER